MSRLLVEAGKALYGARWQSELARALGVNERTVRRWAVGGAHPRPGVYDDVRRLIAERRLLLRRVWNALPDA